MQEGDLHVFSSIVAHASLWLGIQFTSKVRNRFFKKIFDSVLIISVRIFICFTSSLSLLPDINDSPVKPVGDLVTALMLTSVHLQHEVPIKTMQIQASLLFKV